MLTDAQFSSGRVAIIHDWLNGYRGGERVLEAICELFPDAEIFTLFHVPGSVGAKLERHTIHASFLNRLPGARRFYRHFLPLFPMAIESLDLSPFDLVISSSTCVAKGVIPSPKAVHVCYCNTPMRYAWDRYRDYFTGVMQRLAFPFIHYLRIWDVTSSARVHRFMANSNWVAKRIRTYYRRRSDVVFCFVDLTDFPKAIAAPKQDYYLVVSAFAPYKRIDLAIDACRKLGRKLVIVGGGQDEAKLRALGSENIEYLGRVEVAKLREVYSAAKALLFPGEEDFGITPLEAMACGTPVIAFGRGGATDTVIDNETGLFFSEQTTDALAQAIERFESRAQPFSPERCRARAEEFTRERFQREFLAVVKTAWAENHS